MKEMYFVQVFCAVLTVINYASSEHIQGGIIGGHREGQILRSGIDGAGTENFSPRPYRFSFVAPDTDSFHYRKEEGDANGNIQGYYGYIDRQGLHRHVDYVANAAGFKANVRTNEPGAGGKENPADVRMNAEPPPVGFHEKHTGHSGYGNGKYGATLNEFKRGHGKSIGTDFHGNNGSIKQEHRLNILLDNHGTNTPHAIVRGARGKDTGFDSPHISANSYNNKGKQVGRPGFNSHRIGANVRNIGKAHAETVRTRDVGRKLPNLFSRILETYKKSGY